jgi:hypothetical protein
MTALVQVISRLSVGTDTEGETLKLIALFCAAGLLVSVLFALYGPSVDLTSVSF